MSQKAIRDAGKIQAIICCLGLQKILGVCILPTNHGHPILIDHSTGLWVDYLTRQLYRFKGIYGRSKNIKQKNPCRVRNSRS
ncbi:MAG: hypothetical protein OXE99_04360, partial [Cellvibrionales bacterium]|nr:hypothetical protein [Cellvibrionales bacterium]